MRAGLPKLAFVSLAASVEVPYQCTQWFARRPPVQEPFSFPFLAAPNGDCVELGSSFCNSQSEPKQRERCGEGSA